MTAEPARGVPHAVIDHLRAHLDDTADEIAGALLDDTADDELAGRTSIDALRDIVRVVGASLLDALEAGRVLSETEVNEIEKIGEAQGTGGISSEAVSGALLRALAIGQRRVLEAWHAAGSAESAGPARSDPTGVRAALDAFTRLGESFAGAFQAGFFRAQNEALREQTSRAHQARDEFLRRVLERPLTDGAAVLRKAGRLGLQGFAPPFAVVVLRQRPARPDESLFEDAAACARSLPLPVSQPVTFEDDPDLPDFAALVVPHCTKAHLPDLRRGLHDACRRIGLAAVYGSSPDVEGLRTVFVGLRNTVPVVDACASLTGPAAPVDRLLPYLMVKGLAENRQHALLQFTAERPAEGASPAVTADHLQTLRSALDHLAPNISDVARSRGVHRNTVRNHLETIEQATRLSVVDDWFVFTSSFLLRDLIASEPHLG